MTFRMRFAILLASIALLLGVNASHHALSAEAIANLVNQDRISHGLEQLAENPELNLAALAKAKDMLDKNYFAHVSPEGLEPWHWFNALGYKYSYAGENLAEGFTNASDLEKSWMSSPKHRANILSPFYSEQGIAVVLENNTTIVVQFFGSTENKVTLRQ